MKKIIDKFKANIISNIYYLINSLLIGINIIVIFIKQIKSYKFIPNYNIIFKVDNPLTTVDFDFSSIIQLVLFIIIIILFLIHNGYLQIKYSKKSIPVRNDLKDIYLKSIKISFFITSAYFVLGFIILFKIIFFDNVDDSLSHKMYIIFNNLAFYFMILFIFINILYIISNIINLIFVRNSKRKDCLEKNPGLIIIDKIDSFLTFFTFLLLLVHSWIDQRTEHFFDLFEKIGMKWFNFKPHLNIRVRGIYLSSMFYNSMNFIKILLIISFFCCFLNALSRRKNADVEYELKDELYIRIRRVLEFTVSKLIFFIVALIIIVILNSIYPTYLMMVPQYALIYVRSSSLVILTMMILLFLAYFMIELISFLLKLLIKKIKQKNIKINQESEENI